MLLKLATRTIVSLLPKELARYICISTLVSFCHFQEKFVKLDFFLSKRKKFVKTFFSHFFENVVLVFTVFDSIRVIDLTWVSAFGHNAFT